MVAPVKHVEDGNATAKFSVKGNLGRFFHRADTMQQYPNYTYYPQSYPPPNAVPNGYPQFYPQVPPHPGHIQPVPYDQYATPYSQAPVVPAGPPDRHKPHRRNNTIGALPLKSALKQPSTSAPPSSSDHHPNPLTRQRTNSTGYNILARTRTQSNPRPPDLVSGKDPNFVPVHMFISFRNSNEIRFENIPQPAVDELEKRLKRLWPPGAEHQAIGVGDWVVKFRDSPWELKTHVKDKSALYHSRFIYALCETGKGYVFRTAINLRDQYPRLVFEATATDSESEFFLAFFSKGGRQFNLVNPPSHIDLSLGAHLKTVLPHRIARDEIEEDGKDSNIRAIELKKKRYSAPVVEPSYFMMHIFKLLSDMGFSLYASVPLARNGLLSFMSNQEILVFKGRSPSG